MKSKWVLITGGLERKTLASTQLFASKGLKVAVGDSSNLAPALWSKYCSKKIIYPSSQKYPEEHVDFILNEIKIFNYDLLLPTSEYEVHLYSKYKSELSNYVNVATPDPDVLEYAKDKAKTMTAASKMNIPCPKTYIPESLADAKNMFSEIDEFPLIIKPRVSSGSRGLSIVHNRSELESEYARIHSNYSLPIIQEFIPSNEKGNVTLVLFDKKCNLVSRFSYRRLREYPVKAGVSTIVESIKREDQETIAIDFMKKIGWIGLAMVEFRRDLRDGIPKVIEINERLNASTKLSIISGLPIPYILYQIYTQETVEPVFDYKLGMKCRWLFPGDILHFLSNPNRLRMDPPFFRFFDKNTRYEFLSLDDPLPFFMWSLWMGKGLFSREVWDDYIWRKTSRRK